MKTLKLKIFEVLSNITSIQNFEKWLYEEPKIINAVGSDDLIYDIMTIDYSDKNSFSELEKLAFDHYSYEEFLAFAIEKYCVKILNATKANTVFGLIYLINRFFNYKTEYALLWDFYELFDLIDLVEYGHMKEKSAIKSIKKIASGIVESFEQAIHLDEKVELLKAGHRIQHTTNDNARKWYKLWK
ncbi:hypothetical protein GTQ40_13170 [Flavobacteriaceae bacterium R38]|nr:hypothetical protein [Flavobacteriaceae bacterium R38]